MKFLEKLEIESYNAKGDGVHDKTSVPGTIKGEVVNAFQMRKKSARLDSIVTASSERVASPCIHDAECGGCRWAHLNYESQLREKQKICDSLFGDWNLKPMIPSLNLWKFRHKMEFSFSQDRKGKRYFGLYDPITKRVNTLTQCMIAPEWVSDMLEKIMQWWESTDLEAYHPPSNSGALHTVTFRTCRRTNHKMIALMCSLHADYPVLKKHQESLLKFCNPSDETSVYMLLKAVKKGVPTQIFEHRLQGPDAMVEHIPHPLCSGVLLKYMISPQSFFQPNLYQIDHLLRVVLSLAKIKPTSVVCDLYCGVGLFGIAASFLCKKVWACEISPSSSVDMNENIKLMERDNIVFKKSDAEEFLHSIDEKIDVMFVDPPRCGLGDKMIETLLGMRVHKICYVSCNPHSQKEDVLKLIERGYEVNITQPLDQFPHTPHIENIIILERKQSEF